MGTGRTEGGVLWEVLKWTVRMVEYSLYPLIRSLKNKIFWPSGSFCYLFVLAAIFSKGVG